jgi:glycosyltransferase involved in cell wall biosynthesis
MGNLPQFSVIIPTYNRLDLLSRTLASVRNQTFNDYEIIVIDDGSTDQTWEYLSSADHSIKAFRQNNQGAGPARNLGAAKARGRYFVFLDSDDVWFPWTLATFFELIRKRGEPAILSGKFIEFSEACDLEAITDEGVAADVFTNHLASSRSRYFVGANNMVLRRDVFLESGGFVDGRLNCEDHDLMLRLGLAPGFVQVLAPTTLGWYRHAASETSDLRSTVDGLSRMIRQERTGAYPGGLTCAKQRRCLITSHTRAAAVGCLRADRLADAWRLYRTTLGWNVKLRRWKYILLFPVLATAACCAPRNWMSKRSQQGLRGSAHNNVPPL